MAVGLSDIQTILEGVTGVIAVFNDGYLRDEMVDARHLGNVPYAEIKETESDDLDHTSTDRMQRRLVEGRLICRKNIDSYATFLDRLRGAFDSKEQYHVEYSERPDFSPQTFAIEFNIRFFTTVVK